MPTVYGKLGRVAPTGVDAEHLRALPLLTAYFDPKKMPVPPLARYWSTDDGTPFGIQHHVSMFANNQLGDCTCATLGHQDQLAAAAANMNSPLQDRDIIMLYRGSGYTPGDSSSDQGWSNIAAARAALRAGWIEALARFDATNPALLKVVVNEFGYAMVGINLPLSAQAQTGPGKLWEAAPDGSLSGQYKPNSWGGHAGGVVDCDGEGVTLATWGAFQRASWSFVANYFDHNDGIATLNRFWAERARQRGLTASGIALDELKADIARLDFASRLWP